MENLIKFLEDKITDKMSVEEIVDVFEQMCSTPLEEEYGRTVRRGKAI